MTINDLTVFQRINWTHYGFQNISISEIFEIIRTGNLQIRGKRVGEYSLKQITEAIRSVPDSNRQNQLKEAYLPAVTFNGVWDGSCICQYSNYTVFDFDYISTAEESMQVKERLLTPSSSTITIIQVAKTALEKIYRQGYQYKKAGVIVMGVTADNPIQHDLFDISPKQYEKLKSLDEVMDRINRIHGTETLVLGSQQYTKNEGNGKADVFANAIKHDFRSPNPTTRWSDVIKLK